MRFRVATYNVHKCRGMDWRVSTARILHVVRELNADILAVQEIFADQASFLGHELGTHYVFGAARDLNGQPYGNALFSRFAIERTQRYDMTVGSREPRSCLCVDLEPPRGALRVFALHLGTSLLERRHQAEKLEQFLLEPSAAPRIVLGDFNEWTRGAVTRQLSSRLKIHHGRHYPGLLPFLHLDQIYYDPPLHLIAAKPHRSRTALLASDHLPLVAELE